MKDINAFMSSQVLLPNLFKRLFDLHVRAYEPEYFIFKFDN